MPQGFEYYRPKTRIEAVDLFSRPDTNNTPLLIHPRPEMLDNPGVDAYVDLGLLDLDYIRMTEDAVLHMGATTSLESILDNQILQTGTKGLINQAAGQVAPQRIRNMSSLWGAIQARSGPPEFILALLALDADIHTLNRGEMQHTVGFPTVYNVGTNSLSKSELVIEASFLSLPESGCGWALERVARTPMDEAIVSAIAIVEVKDSLVQRVRLALAGANPLPARIGSVENMLQGQSLSPDLISSAAKSVAGNCSPISDFRGSAEYRRAMAETVIRRAIHRAWEQAIQSFIG
jgi:aerobic carbon-monoxide dehydrogenase medium subunit